MLRKKNINVRKINIVLVIIVVAWDYIFNYSPCLCVVLDQVVLQLSVKYLCQGNITISSAFVDNCPIVRAIFINKIIFTNLSEAH